MPARRVRRYPRLVRFLGGRLFYTDAANTMIAVMGIYASKEIGFSDREVSYVLAAGIVAAVAGGFAWGPLADRRGPRWVLLRVIGLWGAILVATALVMLMMLLFAEVFGAAIGTMTAQRGIANNDQKARSFTTVLRHDLDGMTFRAAASRGQTGAAYFEPDANASGVFDIPAEDWSGNGRQDTIVLSARGVVPLAPGDAVEPEQEGYLYYSENDVERLRQMMRRALGKEPPARR